MTEHTRKVGDRGQVTIPKELRDRRGIEGGDEIRFIEVNGEIIIKPPTDEERLAEGYKKEQTVLGSWSKRWRERQQKQPSDSGILRSGASEL